jgi:multidrug efflux pump subunit AcrB
LPFFQNPTPLQCVIYSDHHLYQYYPRTTEIVEAEKLTFSVRRPGPPQGEDIEIQLVSSNDDQRQTAANALAEILSQIEGVDNIDRDDDPSKSRIEVVLDFEKMARLNVDFVTVNRYLKAADRCPSKWLKSGSPTI